MKEWVMPKYILTVNISSSGIDSCLFDDNLKTVAHVFVPLSNYSDEIHPEDIVTMFIDSIRRLLMKMKSKPGTVSALCISAEPYSYVCVDKNNNPLSLISLWSDSKNFTKNENKIFEGKEEELHKRTGCPISSAFPFKRMYFSKLREYDKFVESYKFLSLKSYLIAILTKQFVEDVATASLSGLFDINDKYWSFDALKILEITEAKLPTVKSPYEIIKTHPNNHIIVDVRITPHHSHITRHPPQLSQIPINVYFLPCVLHILREAVSGRSDLVALHGIVVTYIICIVTNNENISSVRHLRGERYAVAQEVNRGVNRCA